MLPTELKALRGVFVVDEASRGAAAPAKEDAGLALGDGLPARQRQVDVSARLDLKDRGAAHRRDDLDGLIGDLPGQPLEQLDADAEHDIAT